MQTVYLICPVRGATPEELAAMTEYVDRLEATGEYQVHFPPRDVDQANDDGGVRICRTHARAMMDADEVHVWLRADGALSEGEHFDLGMAFVLYRATLGKIHYKFVVANPPLERTPYKSFTNLLRALVDETK